MSKCGQVSDNRLQLCWCCVVDYNGHTTSQTVTEGHRGASQWHHEAREEHHRAARHVPRHGDAGRAAGTYSWYRVTGQWRHNIILSVRQGRHNVLLSLQTVVPQHAPLTEIVMPQNTFHTAGSGATTCSSHWDSGTTKYFSHSSQWHHKIFYKLSCTERNSAGRVGAPL